MAPTGAAATIVFENVRIFDGVHDTLARGNVLVRGSKIERVTSDPIAPPPNSEIIDGGGRVLMPGLTDAHAHLTMELNTLTDMEKADPGLMYANTVVAAKQRLLDGFTSVRDMAGPAFGIKDAIDAGIIPGPRIYPSGALVSQTSGHGDFAPPYAPPKILGGQSSHFEKLGVFAIADGVPEVLGAVREQLKKGASQIKLAGSGGFMSDFDPIDGIQFTPEELEAAVRAARDWGTYVAVHAYPPPAIRRALDAGVLSIEHGHLADEATIELIGHKNAWLSTQPFEPGDHSLSPAQAQKEEPILGTWPRILGWAKKHRVKVAFGTDLFFRPAPSNQANVMLTRFAKVYSNVEVLRIATSGNCELFARSGNRNPYKEAKLGVIEEGAWADMLLVDGDPTKDIELLADPDRSFVLIMKSGIIYKDALRR